MVRVWGREVWGTTTLPKVIWVGVGRMPPTAIPLPSRGTVRAATPALVTWTVRVPGWSPEAVGTKRMPAVQKAFPLSVTPQVVGGVTRA